MLNHDSPIPLYHQLADILLEQIRSGEYPEGAKIPSEHVLAETYGIGRPTARQATDLLVRKRVLVRKRGAGTFVLPRPKEVDLFSLAGTISSFEDRGIALQTEIIEPIRLQAVAEDGENPFSGQRAYFLSRRSTVQDLPVLIEDIYLHEVLFAGIDALEVENRSLSRIVSEQFYMRLQGGDQNFRIGYLSGDKAGQLQVSPDTPILMVRRFLHFPQSDNAIYSELFCRTDQFVFSQKLRGMHNE